MDLKKIIDKKDWASQYMIDEISHIIKTFEKRSPGSKGEYQACEYMAEVLKNDCGCEDVKIESFKENPGSFYGWIFLTITMVLIGVAAFFIFPLLSIILIVAGLIILVLQFGLYKKVVDRFFPEKTSHNVTAIKKCSGETKRRIVFNGHPDAAWEWPVNYRFGGVAFEAHAIISIVGALFFLILSIIYIAENGVYFEIADLRDPIVKAGILGILFVPFQIGLFWMVNEELVVDGANDNLSGCYMGISILKALKDEGIELENTEIAVVLTGSEEAGLRGSMAWCDEHIDDFRDVPTFFYSFDTIHDPEYLMVNYRDLNGTVKSDTEVSDLFMEAADELGIKCIKGMVPPMGGATDSAAFTKSGFRATGITGLNHKLENYYHTRRDTYDNLNADGLAGCYAVSVKTLEKFDNGAKQ